MSALQPWREQLRADPARVVEGVLDGWLDRGPWQRAEAMDFLLDLAAGDAALSELAAAATLGWLRDRLSWDERTRLAFGPIAHASRLAEAFAVLQRLDAPRTAYQLAEQAAWFESRTRALHFDKRLDLHRLFWLALAFQQPDDRFLPRWLDFCGQAAGLAPAPGWKEWLRLGITGLRMLEVPPGGLPVDQHALAGLLLFHRRAPQPLLPEVEAFELQQLEVLKSLFPRGPDYWPEKLSEARERWPERRELPGWMQTGKANNRPRHNHSDSALPSGHEIRAMEQRIRQQAPDRALWQAIAAWFQRCHDYALRTGDVEALTKAVGNFGDKFLKRRPAADLLNELLDWMRIALDWDLHDARRWTQLAAGLSALNQTPAAEALLWEALRRFPDNEICRTSLAEFLRRQNRPAEAEHLLRETMARFPDDDVCRNSLAEFLREQNRLPEAEALLRETMADFPDDDVCRNSLAEFLREQNRLPEAEHLLRETMEDFQDDVVCRANLAELLIESGRFAEAEDLLEATIKIKQFSRNEHIRSILAKAWIKHGEPAKAEKLLRESAETFDRNVVFPKMLNALLAGKYADAVAWTKPLKQRRKTARFDSFAAPAQPLADPLYAWAAERAPITRLVFGFNREAEIHQQLQAAARSGGAAELAEVALRLLFPQDAVALEDALRVRPGSPALRLLQAGPDRERGLRIAETMPEAEPVLHSLYQTSADSSAWQPRFRAAVLALADMSPPPVYIGAPA